MDQNDFENSRQAPGLPIVFVSSPNAFKSPRAIAEELAASILRDEFLREIHT